MTETTRMTFDEFYESMTGTEEVAVEEAFGTYLENVFRSHGGMRYSRAVLFVLRLREGKSPSQAKREVMGLTRRQMNSEADRYFVDDDPGDVDPDDPESESGKDDSPAA